MNKQTACAYTVIYITNNSSVLLIKRSPSKKINPNKISGLGGKVERGENILDSAQRELKEESGIICNNLTLTGTLTIIDDEPVRRVLYIYTGHASKNITEHRCDEGKLKWYPIQKIVLDINIAFHQKLFIKDILINKNQSYTGIFISRDGENQTYCNNSLCH